jgi:hypothetical protein
MHAVAWFLRFCFPLAEEMPETTLVSFLPTYLLIQSLPAIHNEPGDAGACFETSEQPPQRQPWGALFQPHAKRPKRVSHLMA